MKIEDLDLLERPAFQQLSAAGPPTTGTVDDNDDAADEQPNENEAPVRETREATEAPEEFEIDDEDDLGHPEDDDDDADIDDDDADEDDA
jgi:hypothetical protein